jgi:hypothetical protein
VSPIWQEKYLKLELVRIGYRLKNASICQLESELLAYLPNLYVNIYHEIDTLMARRDGDV